MATATAAVPAASNAPGLSNSTFRPETDELRAFAVIAVIIIYFNNNVLPSGYSGVDVFS